MNLETYIKDYPDFPKQGIIFKDISPILANPTARKELITQLAAPYLDKKIDVVVGIESRGFLVGMLLANALDARFVMIRKPGKLPGVLMTQSYELEYGTDTIEMQQDAISSNDRVLIHDDVLATGGTAAAAQALITSCGAQIAGFSFIIALSFLSGRDKLANTAVHAAINY